MAASRLFTVEQKRDIVAAYEVAPYGTKRQVLAAHDISAHQVTDWRAARDAGLLEVGATVRRPVATPRAESAEIARLRREVTRLEAEVVRARKDADDRQCALETLGKAPALVHALVSPRSADSSFPPAPSAGSK
ncbi:MAG TPA: transposase [Thermomicrobiales bacterium]|nr:transposase [Thermomicrobiales bacterium]